MPLLSEVSYWNSVASKTVKLDGPEYFYVDNHWKRPFQVKNLMSYDWAGHKILEIGTGNGVIGNCIKAISGPTFDYTGTDVSERFADFSRQLYRLNVVQADVLELPGRGYTRIIAMDALEHVRPEHREQGYKRIYEVAANGALLFIHYSFGESYHDKNFDHPFNLGDFAALEKVGFKLMKYERYVCPHPKGDIPYAFAVMQK